MLSRHLGMVRYENKNFRILHTENFRRIHIARRHENEYGYCSRGVRWDNLGRMTSQGEKSIAVAAKKRDHLSRVLNLKTIREIDRPSEQFFMQSM